MWPGVPCANTIGKMSESSMSTSSSASAWGADDPLVSVEGVRTTVLGGRPVWPWALHQLLTADDRWAYLESRLVKVDFTALPLGPRSAGAQFLEEVREGHDVDWANSRIPPDQADRVLAALGLLHMRVKCVVFDPNGEYDNEVSGACGRQRGHESRLTYVFLLYCLPDALVGGGRDGG